MFLVICSYAVACPGGVVVASTVHAVCKRYQYGPRFKPQVC